MPVDNTEDYSENFVHIIDMKRKLRRAVWSE